MFSAYATQAEADLVCERLNGHGLQSRVELIQAPGAIPWTTFPVKHGDVIA